MEVRELAQAFNAMLDAIGKKTESTHRLAYFDPLTGAANRSRLQEKLDAGLEQCESSGVQLAVMFFDLDRFKHINDTLGHAIGDEILRGFYRTVDACRPADGDDSWSMVARLGAEAGFVIGETDTDMPGDYDAVIEASGAPQAFNQALDQVRKQGRVVILSNIQRSATPIDLHRIMLKEFQVTGSFQFHREFLHAIDLIASGRVDFHRLIAARFDVAETGDALALMASGEAAGKILIKPSATKANGNSA